MRSLSEADFSDPSVPALTPVLCETGEVGVSVSLGRFTEDDQGQLHVDVSVARSGLDGAAGKVMVLPGVPGRCPIFKNCYPCLKTLQYEVMPAIDISNLSVLYCATDL